MKQPVLLQNRRCLSTFAAVTMILGCRAGTAANPAYSKVSAGFGAAGGGVGGASAAGGAGGAGAEAGGTGGVAGGGSSGAGGSAGTGAPSAGSGGRAGRGGAGGTGGTGGASSACSSCDDGKLCDEATGSCVQCLESTDCRAPTPVCDTGEKRCVACIEDGDCKDPATPACDRDAEACVGCTNSAKHCAGETPECDLDVQTCVQCLSDGDCDDPAASRCDAGECRPCSANTHCGHLQGLKVCDPTLGTGQCVQCTGTDYGTCGIDVLDTGLPFICDSLDHTCTERTKGTSGLCGDCVSDAECPAGQLCVLQEFESTTIGYFCAWRKQAGVGGAPSSCAAARPYVNAVPDTESIDGTAAEICTLRTSTCPAHNDFSSAAVNCAPGGIPDDALCGFGGVQDGYCRLFESSPDVYRCTVPCLSSDDCQIGSDCQTLVTPRVCEL